MRNPPLRWLLCSALLATSLPLRGDAQTQRDDHGPSMLRPGDVLRLTVWQRPELSGDFTVGDDGSVAHPLYQPLRVAGVPLAVVEQRVQELLRTYVAEPRVTMQPLIRVAVSGEVRQPGLVLVAPTTSLAQVVALAGGPTERGEMSRVRLVRDTRQMVLDLSGASSVPAPLHARSGDQLWVDRQVSLLRDRAAPIASLASAVALVTYYVFKRH